MESNQQKFPKLGEAADNSDAKYVSGLSTYLVATIQEVKDRISQIEYIFCEQLFPNIQLKIPNFQKIHSEAKEAAELEYKEKEKDLLLQITKIQSEKEHVLEENKLMKEEKKIRELEKSEVQRNLLKKVELQDSEMLYKDELLNKCENENVMLAGKIKNLVNHVDELKELLAMKNNELEDGRNMQEQSQKKINSFNTVTMKRGQELEKYEKERKLLLDKQRDLIENVNKLQQGLNESSKESSKTMERLLKQLEAKESEIQSEKEKRRNEIVRYKKLKSQYLHMCKKQCYISEPIMGHEEEIETIRENQSLATSCDDKIVPKAIAMTSKSTKPEGKKDSLDEKRAVVLTQKSSPVSPSTLRILIAPKNPTVTKSCPPVGAKRPISSWRDTRSHQNCDGPDPHDDFLNTPLEKIRRNSGKVIKAENHDRLMNMNFDDSDDETQDMIVDLGPEKEQMPPQKVGTSGFKYVEPVRKKAERENLKGVECKQCKKFYDAVLPEAGQNPDGSKQIRCEHHDGVSRHRYKYVPPLTPEGFWNIGFESEM